MKKKVIVSPLGVLVLAGGISSLSTQALASEFSAGVGGSGSCVEGTSPASGNFNFTTNGTGSSTVSASSTADVLEGNAVATVTGNRSADATSVGTFCAKAVIDDLVICGPGASTSVQLTAELSGATTLTSFRTTSTTAQVRARSKIRDPGGISSPIAAADESIGANVSNLPIAQSFTTDAVTLPTGIPLEIELTLEGQLSATDDFADPESANAQLEARLRFPESGDVLTLPAGFTASSVDGMIINNQVVDTLPSNPEINVTATDSAASEDGPDSGTFTFTRSGGNNCQAVSATYTLTGAAINGTDYNSIALTVTFPSGDTTPKTVNVLPVEDTEVEGDEPVVLTLASCTDCIIGNDSSATIIISDNDVVAPPPPPPPPAPQQPSQVQDIHEVPALSLISLISLMFGVLGSGFFAQRKWSRTCK